MRDSANSFTPTRRVILKGVASVALIGLGATFGLSPALAAANDAWPDDAFKAKSEADTIKALYGKAAEVNAEIKIDAPEIAENGAVVPIGISTKLPGVTSISILVAENPNALAARYRIFPGTIPSVASRLKMAKTSNVIALVEVGDKLFKASKEIKVTVGGCGG